MTPYEQAESLRLREIHGPGCDDHLPLPTNFLAELRRLTAEREQRERETTDGK